MQYIFGPVPSRRLGFSLGIDLVPFKTCSLDCPYCQLGKTTHKTIQRQAYGSPEEIITDPKKILSKVKTFRKDYQKVHLKVWNGYVLNKHTISSVNEK